MSIIASAKEAVATAKLVLLLGGRKVGPAVKNDQVSVMMKRAKAKAAKMAREGEPRDEVNLVEIEAEAWRRVGKAIGEVTRTNVIWKKAKVKAEAKAKALADADVKADMRADRRWNNVKAEVAFVAADKGEDEAGAAREMLDDARDKLDTAIVQAIYAVGDVELFIHSIPDPDPDEEVEAALEVWSQASSASLAAWTKYQRQEEEAKKYFAQRYIYVGRVAHILENSADTNTPYRKNDFSLTNAESKAVDILLADRRIKGLWQKYYLGRDYK